MTNNLLPSVQLANHSILSTEIAMLRIVSYAYDAENRPNVTLLAFLNLSAAFGCLEHVTLLSRLRESFGI